MSSIFYLIRGFIGYGGSSANSKFDQYQYGPSGLPRDVEFELINKAKRNEVNNHQANEGETSVHLSEHQTTFKDFFKEMESQFEHMNEIMMGGFGNNRRFDSGENDNTYNNNNIVEFHIVDGVPEFPNFESDVPGGTSNEIDMSPRSKMLREDEQSENSQFGEFRPFTDQPTHPPQPLGDQNLDGDLENGELSVSDIILGEDKLNKTVLPNVFSSFNYSSTSKKVNPDGSIETRTTRRDGQGNEETTVTRMIGDQSHTAIHRRDRNGVEQNDENLINIDSGALNQYEEKWNPDQDSFDGGLVPPSATPTVESLNDIISSWWKS